MLTSINEQVMNARHSLFVQAHTGNSRVKQLLGDVEMLARPVALALSTVIALMVPQVHAGNGPSLKLWRLDCGVIQVDDLNDFSDTYAYTGRSKRLTASCYLIKHGDDYMLWDTGLPKSDLGLPLQGKDSKRETLSASLADQLGQLAVDPKKIALIGISHYHYDHTGQVDDFHSARLLLGRGDVQALRAPDNPEAKALAKALAYWLNGPGKLDEVIGDRDVFGDGLVVMLDLPGHTPGHHGLLLKLSKFGYVVLSADVAHFRENYESDGLPRWNTDRAQSLASLQRVKQIVRNLQATLVIQHEVEDIEKLPKFPDAAE